MTTISKTLVAALFAASATWVAGQTKAQGAPFEDRSTQTKAAAQCTQASKIEAAQGKNGPKQEAITVSVTPFLKSADPHPLPSIPKRKAKSQKAKVRASR